MPHSLHYTNFLIRQSQILNAALPHCRTAALSCLLLNRLCGKPEAICTLFTNKSIDDFLLKNLFISKILIIFAFKYWHIRNELCQE